MGLRFNAIFYFLIHSGLDTGIYCILFNDSFAGEFKLPYCRKSILQKNKIVYSSKYGLLVLNEQRRQTRLISFCLSTWTWSEHSDFFLNQAHNQSMHLLEEQQKLMILNKIDRPGYPCQSYLYDMSTSEFECIPHPQTLNLNCRFSVFCCGSKVILITRESPSSRFMYFDMQQKIWKHTELPTPVGYVKQIWFDEEKCALLAICKTGKKNKIKMLRVHQDILTPRDINWTDPRPNFFCNSYQNL